LRVSIPIKALLEWIATLDIIVLCEHSTRLSCVAYRFPHVDIPSTALRQKRDIATFCGDEGLPGNDKTCLLIDEVKIEMQVFPLHTVQDAP
jgi:hypothetical protein